MCAGQFRRSVRRHHRPALRAESRPDRIPSDVSDRSAHVLLCNDEHVPMIPRPRRRDAPGWGDVRFHGMNPLLRQLTRRLRFEVRGNMIDVKCMSRHHEMRMIGKNRERKNYVAPLLRSAREPPRDRARLFSRESNGRIAQSLLRREASFNIVRIVRERAPRRHLRRRPERAEFVFADDVGPRSTWVVGEPEPLAAR